MCGYGAALEEGGQGVGESSPQGRWDLSRHEQRGSLCVAVHSVMLSAQRLLKISRPACGHTVLSSSQSEEGC